MGNLVDRQAPEYTNTYHFIQAQPKWLADARAIIKNEDAALNRICDERQGGPFFAVTLDELDSEDRKEGA